MLRDVTVTLDQARVLRYGFQALLDLQHISKEPLGIFQLRLGSISADHIIWALWAGLKHGFATLTVEQVVPLVETYLVNGGTLDELVQDLNKALFLSGLFKEEKPTLPSPLAPEPPPATP